MTDQRSIACNDRDGLEQEYPDFKEQSQSQQATESASPTTGNDSSPEHQKEVQPVSEASPAAPSFDCMKASTKVEVLIWNDVGLAKATPPP